MTYYITLHHLLQAVACIAFVVLCGLVVAVVVFCSCSISISIKYKGKGIMPVSPVRYN